MQGGPLSPNRLGEVVRNYVEAARIGKRRACHLFRHAMASLMLEGFIQQMLGHSQLNTTQSTLTCLDTDAEANPFGQPAAPLTRSPSDDQHAMLVHGQMWPGDPAPTAKELFATLDAESAEEEQE